MGFSLNGGGHDWFGLIEVLAFVLGSGIFSLLAAKYAGRNATKTVEGKVESVQTDVQQKFDSVQSDVQKISGHVANGHTTPLRADMDRLIKGQDTMLRLLTDTHGLVADHNRAIGNIREDLGELGERVDRVTPVRRAPVRGKKET